MKKNNKWLLTIPSILTAATIAPIISVAAIKNIETSNSIVDTNTNADINQNNQDQSKPLVPMVSNYYNAKLSSKNGPITFWKDNITSLDWFGAERWSIDVKNISFEDGKVKPFDTKNMATSWKRPWLNYDIDKENDVLYVLSNAGVNTHQYVVSIDIQTGQPIKYWKTTQVIETNAWNVNNKAFFTVKVLANGNIAITGIIEDVGKGNSDIIEIINPKTNEVTRYNGNITDTVVPKPVPTEEEKKQGYDYSTSNNSAFNFIPISDNRNLMVVYNLTGQSGSKGDEGAKKGTSEVWFVLVDDHFNLITTANQSWQKAVPVTKAITGTKNSITRPQTDVHKLIDGRTVTIIYDKLIIIDPKDPNNPTLSISPIGNGKWIESWSFDSSETLYFKEKDETIIKQVKLDPNRDNYSNPKHTVSVYYDLSKSPLEQIRNSARDLVLYNVYGYIGQIMLLNSYHKDYVDDYKNTHTNKNPQGPYVVDDTVYPKDEAEIKKNMYGLAVAITNNANKPGEGDTKGLLNTENAFQKSADFDISQEVLKNKLPSEITRNDIDYKNKSFLTTNTTKNPDGTLKYEPFTKNVIKDNEKKLEITLHLDQIPWFVTNNKVPNDVVPLKIHKKFDFQAELSSRFSWKDSDKQDYDFKNTLPSKLTVDDIKRIDPLVSTLSSQRATINGVSYPSTTYSIENPDDAKGTVTIKADYKYLPFETKAIESNLLTYSTSKTYNIFKSTDTRKMVFVGETENDVSKIPELKDIKESDKLPSSFVGVSKQEYLRFIDTNKTSGYPLEKMKINATANDAAGTLTITIDPQGYDNQLQVQTKTYSGLNKSNQYKFNFGDWTDTEKKKILPSEINEELFYQHFVNFNGFNPSDFDLVLYPNDVNGTLVARVTLLGDYPDGPTTGTDFKNESGKWVAQKEFSNFKNIVDFNQEYQINFKKENDNSLSEIQKLTPSEIENKLKSAEGLKVNNTTYKSKEELVELFIESKGSKIPSNFQDKTNITVDMFINNGGGEITWSIKFNKLDNYPNPVTFLETIGGFVKGNNVATSDVFTFANTNQLKKLQPELFNKSPSQIQKELEQNKKDINKFFLNAPTGGYLKAYNNNEFDLEIFADDSNGYLNITIKFKRTSENQIDPKSILEYSQNYTGFVFA